MIPSSPSPETVAPETVAPRPILVIGPGRMGAEYVKVLRHLGFPPETIRVLGRDRGRVEAFAVAHGGVCPAWGGLNRLDADAPPETAIVALPPGAIEGAVERLMALGCRRILAEKPLALTAVRAEALAAEAVRRGVGLSVSYNRRFLPSVREARRMIAEDGGLISCAFDFTELERYNAADTVSMAWPKDRWGVVNSSHVIDLFRHLAGQPADWSHRRAGSLAWHPAGAVFCGSGVTERGVLFSYLSTWSGAGRWGMELTTARRKLILRPLEAVVVQENTGFATATAGLPAEPEGLKPGFLGLVEAFLADHPPAPLCSAAEAAASTRLVETIMGYKAS